MASWYSFSNSLPIRVYFQASILGDGMPILLKLLKASCLKTDKPLFVSVDCKRSKYSLKDVVVLIVDCSSSLLGFKNKNDQLPIFNNQWIRVIVLKNIEY